MIKYFEKNLTKTHEGKRTKNEFTWKKANFESLELRKSRGEIPSKHSVPFDGR